MPIGIECKQGDVWAPTFVSFSVICVAIVLFFRAFSFVYALTRSDSGSKMIREFAYAFNYKHVLYLTREVQFYTRSILMNRLQYSIYQKRNAKIEQNQEPDQHQTYNKVAATHLWSFFNVKTVSFKLFKIIKLQCPFKHE